MKTPRLISEYLFQFRACLRLETHLKDQIITEVEDHLMEKIERLQAVGIPEEDAITRAILHFGSPEELGLHFESENIKKTSLRSLFEQRTIGIRVLLLFVLFCAVIQLLTTLSATWKENQLGNWISLAQCVLSWTAGVGLLKHRNWSRKVLLLWMIFSMPWGLLLTFTVLSFTGVPFLEFPRPNLVAVCWLVTIVISTLLIVHLFRPHVRDIFS